MDARHAVLLIPSKPSGPLQLPFRQLRKRITHLESTLTEIFASVASKGLTHTLNTLESTLARSRGRGPSAWHRLQSVPLYFRQGCSKPICPFTVPFATHHSPLITRHSSLATSPKRSTQKFVSLAMLCPKHKTRLFLFNSLRALLQFFALFCTVFIFRPFVFNRLRTLLHFWGEGEGSSFNCWHAPG
jgi:hypothetical protein